MRICRPKIAQALRLRGCDVTSAHAAREKRTLVTCNYRDFLILVERWDSDGLHHAGVIISYRQFARSQRGVFVDALQRAIQSLSAEVLLDAVIPIQPFVSDDP